MTSFNADKRRADLFKDNISAEISPPHTSDYGYHVDAIQWDESGKITKQFKHMQLDDSSEV